MPDVALLLAVFLASYIGFAFLALSQDRHWHHVGGTRHCPRLVARLLRVAGYGLLAAAFAFALVRDGAAFGSLLWATMISIGALLVVATLSWRAHWLRPLARLLHHIG